MPRVAARAALEAVEQKLQPRHIPADALFALPDEVRALAARLIGARREEITVGTGATHGLNLAAAGLPLQAGDEVLLGPTEFPANVAPWMEHGRRRGYGVRRADFGPTWSAQDFERMASSKTRAVAVSMVNHATGFRADLEPLGELCRARGWFFVVDACQAVGHVRVQVDRIRPDVLATGGYKWLLSPYGTGFAYVRHELHERLTIPVVNWQGLDGADSVETREENVTRFVPWARRFDGPETASFINLSAMRASLEFLLELGVEAIEGHLLELGDLVREQLPRGFDTPDLGETGCSAIVSIETPPSVPAERVRQRLQGLGVTVGLRAGRLRVSPGIHHSREDLVRFPNLLARAAS
jgi:selenocysteine lyase/cysteine desulfurase